MEESSVEQLSEYEVGLYDRQIRLWGLEGQSRLKQGHILIVRLNCLHQEIAKNSVIGGVSVTLADPRAVTQNDADTLFVVDHDTIGQKLGVVGSRQIQKMNRLVTVDGVSDEDWDTLMVHEFNKSKIELILKRFSVIVLPIDKDLSFERLIQLERTARSLQKGVVFSMVSGMYGFSLFSIPKTRFSKQTTSVDINEKEVHVTKTVEVELPELSQSLDLKDLDKKRKKDAILISFIIVIQWLKDGKISPLEEYAMTKLSEANLDSIGAIVERLKTIWKMADTQSASCGAVLGGLITQVIRSWICRQDLLASNALILDGEEGQSVCWIPLGHCKKDEIETKVAGDTETEEAKTGELKRKRKSVVQDEEDIIKRARIEVIDI